MNTPSFLEPILARYVGLRRKLGYDLRKDEVALRNFVRFADREAPAQPITTSLAVTWAMRSRSADRNCHARRLRVVRGFARFCAALDPRTEVPPRGLLCARWSRRTPHIYTTLQVQQMMGLARSISSKRDPLRPHLYGTLVGLLHCTGMRLGEALRLQITDLDPQGRTLRVPGYKFSCERVLPLHPSAIHALRRYIQLRRRLCPVGEHLFADRRGRPLSSGQLEKTFRDLTRSIVPNGARPRPRWHDFRHSFASNIISYWNHRAEPVAHHLLLLSRYLGHKSFSETWWYVSPNRSDLEAAATRFQAYQRNPQQL